jgi:hypothetical protein
MKVKRMLLRTPDVHIFSEPSSLFSNSRTSKLGMQNLNSTTFNLMVIFSQKGKRDSFFSQHALQINPWSTKSEKLCFTPCHYTFWLSVCCKMDIRMSTDKMSPMHINETCLIQWTFYLFLIILKVVPVL